MSAEAGMSKPVYFVAGCRPWSRAVFEEKLAHLPGEWRFIARPGELTVTALEEAAPEYVFFLHWNWKVPAEITDRFVCVCFHMTDVPYGRGGSPLQNLILRGHKTTKLTALRMVQEMDAGPVYLKADLSLEGRAEEIYRRASYRAVEMIQTLVGMKPEPSPQLGEVVEFKRRRPEESQIGEVSEPGELYDLIRMVDAEGYPPAFFVRNGFRYEFSRAVLEDEAVTATVRIRRETRENQDTQTYANTGDRGAPGR